MKNRAFECFMKGIIDYAGMYPPANLDSLTAFKNYLDYISDNKNLLVSRFVSNIKVLKEIDDSNNELAALYREYISPEWISFSVILSGGKDYKSFLHNLKTDLDFIKPFIEKHIEKSIVDIYEVKLPEEFNNKNHSSHLKKMLDESTEILNDYGFYRTDMYIEPPINNNYENIFDNLINTIAEINHKHGCFGFKLRTGGVTKELVPGIEQVTYAIKKTTECKVRIKATAGLHHPIRHFNDTADFNMHGFLNIFGAGILSYKNNLSYKEIFEIIKDENPESFKFSEEEFLWNDISTDLEGITSGREDYITSFGSCSVEEPLEDLRKLNYDI